MAKVYLKTLMISAVQKKGLQSKEAETVDYDFDIYKKDTK